MFWLLSAEIQEVPKYRNTENRRRVRFFNVEKPNLRSVLEN